MTTLPLKRILMVEDDPDIQAVARLSLEAVGGFTVQICSAGAEAIQVGPAFGPDLILLDVMMPGMDGPSTLRALRAIPRTATTPVIFMTAKVQPHEIAHYKELGVLDVIAKPFDPLTLPATIQSIWSNYRPVTAEDVLKELSESYKSQLPDKMSAIAAAWGHARQSGDREALSTLHRLVHTLRGSSATLGFGALGDLAYRLEQAVGPLVEQEAVPTAAQQSQIESLLAAFQLAAASSDQKATVGSRSVAVVDCGQHAGAADTRLIVLVEADQHLAHDLALQLGYFGYTVQVFGALAGLETMIGDPAPAAIVVDLESAGDIGPEAVMPAGIRRGQPTDPPLICISAHNTLEGRLRAVRAGASAYYTKPVNVGALIDKLDAFSLPATAEPYRVLIVEDDELMANYYAEILRPANVIPFVVSDPLSVMVPLADFRPDLILMDMYMPGCDGVELAAVIRQNEDYVSTPIVFLSAETDLDMQLKAMQLGGDLFLTKPIKPENLIIAVASRIERSRILHSFMARDGLTGLFNHTTVKAHLDVELARSRRHQEPLALAFLDIDHFKQVNDTYGHPTGDQVLKSIARLLQQRLRKSDIIGRYGGEEFAVILPSTDGARAIKVLDQIRARLEHIRQCSLGGEEFSVTFSCGVADLPTYADAPTLTDAADKALYEAKRSGRNQVLLAKKR
jgi:diguanylate cyclase (GGDEF)-like protein